MVKKGSKSSLYHETSRYSEEIWYSELFSRFTISSTHCNMYNLFFAPNLTNLQNKILFLFLLTGVNHSNSFCIAFTGMSSDGQFWTKNSAELCVTEEQSIRIQLFTGDFFWEKKKNHYPNLHPKYQNQFNWFSSN